MTGTTILLVDDDPNDVELTLTAMAEHNLAHRVVVAWDGVEALDYLYQRKRFADRISGDPIVVLLDRKMPRMDGLEVLRQVKSDPRLRTIPVVMLTSSHEERDIVESYDLGVNAYVVKPIALSEFRQVIGRIGLFWAKTNETKVCETLSGQAHEPGH